MSAYPAPASAAHRKPGPPLLRRALLKSLKPLAPWAVPLLLLVVWQAAGQFGWLSSRILPEPLAVLRAFWTLAQSGELYSHVSVSLGRAIYGFVVGGGLGLLLGL
ncbi:MAG: ssuC, partial [Burkholderia sp.]|nr:ssuC [Burkholderia sp.]